MKPQRTKKPPKEARKSNALARLQSQKNGKKATDLTLPPRLPLSHLLIDRASTSLRNIHPPSLPHRRASPLLRWPSRMEPFEPASEPGQPRGDPETVLEGSMWKMELGSEEPPAYPERHGRPDCAYYMRTGTCGFGDGCRYNHPRDRRMVARAARTGSEQHREHTSRPACRYFVSYGSCKFGDTCKYEHPKPDGSVILASLNKYGYPLRPGEKECSYYIRTGHCKFGLTCKFNHPEPSLPLPASPSYSIVQPTLSPSHQQYPVITSWEVGRSSMLPASYMQGPYGPMLLFPGIMPDPGWSTFPVTPSPLISTGGEQNTVLEESQHDSAAQISRLHPAHTESYPMAASVSPSTNNQTENVLPERLDEPDCQDHKRTSYRKLGSRCTSHHRTENIPPETSCVFSLIGHPLHPANKLE
ncbi:unnamed protein product [Musa acuminata subsp. malaccensis]|uniref:(wild Malaysian banana) hypothetical protein n=1 Tax=Musa acuminata subsp. malaccensis TaxID=214687 RepID=A0A804KDX1_MUSAM|nr:PREDICTED: zinc finger CCCH domain-containing protein 32-like isoform X3 [Musa acuminata subsp. malaccensis]CAG1833559.1 unnamed protein product [Musa acuminata subsp. malaccensis]